MKLNNISFPYPVLGVNDDITPMLAEDAIVISCDRGNNKVYKLSVSLKFDNKYIENLINQGYATYVCEIDCVKTNLRRSVACDSPEFGFDINRKYVSGNVTLNCYVTVTKPINGYQNPGTHPDYEDAKFDLTPGDILVGFPEYSFFADPKFDKLQSVTSFMQICKDTENEYTNFKLDDNLIYINLPVSLFDIFNSGVGLSFAEVVHSSIAQTALLGALYEINNYRNKMWAQAIIELLKNNSNLQDNYTFDDEGKLIITDHLKVAIMLLKDPYDRMFHKLEEATYNGSIFN